MEQNQNTQMQSVNSSATRQTRHRESYIWDHVFINLLSSLKSTHHYFCLHVGCWHTLSLCSTDSWISQDSLKEFLLMEDKDGRRSWASVQTPVLLIQEAVRGRKQSRIKASAVFTSDRIKGLRWARWTKDSSLPLHKSQRWRDIKLKHSKEASVMLLFFFNTILFRFVS